MKHRNSNGSAQNLVMASPVSPLHRAARACGRGGFTLLEMIVSLALVLVLMLAVTRIFTTVSTTVGAAQALSAATRDAKAAQAVFARDFGAFAADGPMAIYNGQKFAFRSAIDAQNDPDGNPGTYDPASAGGAEPAVSTTDFSSRNHRFDTICFFARDKFASQTGVNGAFVSNFASREAFIWYGFLRQPDNGGAVNGAGQRPAAADPLINPNNYYASQWILGRAAILLFDPSNAPAGSYQRSGGGATLAPFSFGSNNTNPGGTYGKSSDGWATNSGRYDTAATTISLFRQDVADTITANPNNWWQQFIYASEGNGGNGPNRFFAKPFVQRPYTPEAISFTTPIFIPHCSSFCVEYAGDYVEQNPATGDIQDVNSNGTAAEPDGQIDYVELGGARKIRWYGLPRKTSAPQFAGAATPLVSAANGDVAPLRDTLGAAARFEKRIDLGPSGDYSGSTNNQVVYACAWGPNDLANRPKLIRLTVVIDRPEAQGRLDQGLVFEYVFNLP